MTMSNSKNDVNLESYNQNRLEAINSLAGTLNKQDGYNCQKCNNKGYISYISNNEITSKECECMRIRNILKTARQSGLQKILSQMTFDKFITSFDWQKEIKQQALDFCKDDNANWFYIGGQSGCGKTHICTAISSHYIKLGKPVVYMMWVDESKKLKSITTDRSYSEQIAKFKNAEILYIDDFLKVRNGETPTPADMQLAFEIINSRILNDGKTTLISSEKTLDDIIDYDEATMSRIYQRAGKYKIGVGKDRSKNYRLKN